MTDIQAAFEIYRKNHPGWYDPFNPGFRAQLIRARRDGLGAAAKADDYGSYSRSLDAFAAVLQDGHAGFQSPRRATIKRYWTGFVPAWRGQSLYVLRGTPPRGVEVGARVISCDGMPIKTLILRRLRGRGLRPAEGGQWWFHAPRVFFDSDIFVKPRPSLCTFATERRVVTARLNWIEAPADLDDRFRAAAEGEKTPIGLSEPRQGIFLVGLPDFNPDPSGVAAYRKLFSELAAKQNALRDARAVILDLRWNNGGSSAWPKQTAEALWGKDAVDQRVAYGFRNVEIWWRASPDNIKHTDEIEQTNRKNGNISVADGVHEIAAGMRTALAKGEPFFVQRDTEPVPAPTAKTDFTTRVYVITPGGCASACLDAIDTFKHFPNVRLIGAPTSADSTYLEARTADLPSGEAKATVPTKIWVHRPRKSGEFYKPDIELDELSWSTAAFLDAVERDLITR